MIVIHAEEENVQEEFKREREKLIKEKLEKGYLEANDFMLVRTSNFIGENRTIKPIADIPFIIKTNSLANRSIASLLKEKYQLNLFNDKDLDTYRLLKEEYSHYSTQYRSTIHFTLNGLVSSHLQGNFDNKNFIILDNLEEHLGKEDIRSIRMEDTYISGDVHLSKNAIVMVKEDKFDQFIKENPELNNYNIVLYTGKSDIAVNILLTKLKIVSETIGKDYAIDSPLQNYINTFFKAIEQTYNIKQIKHANSKEYQEDDQKNILLWDLYNNAFYDFLLANIDDINKEEAKENLMNSSYLTAEKTFKSILNRISLEEYKTIVDTFNNTIINKKLNNQLPSNNEIIQSITNKEKH